MLTCGRAGGHVCNEEDLMLACDSNNAGFETVPGFGFPGAGSVPAGTWIGNASGSDDFYKVTNGSGAGCTNIDGPAVTRATNNSYLCCFDNGR